MSSQLLRTTRSLCSGCRGKANISRFRPSRMAISPSVAGATQHHVTRPPLIRPAVGLLYAVPAGVAGYRATLGLAHIGMLFRSAARGASLKFSAISHPDNRGIWNSIT
jgi:hypothetical protein